MLLSVRLGGTWESAVAAWLRYEATYAYHGASRATFPAKYRPKAISDWIQRRRSVKWRPGLLNLEEYQKGYWSWWRSLQPTWRKFEADTTARDTGDWAAMDKPGVNGWLNVVVALFLWGNALREARADFGSWHHVVEDATWVLEQLCLHRASS